MEYRFNLRLSREDRYLLRELARLHGRGEGEYLRKQIWSEAARYKIQCPSSIALEGDNRRKSKIKHKHPS